MINSFHRVTLKVASAPTVPDARVCSHVHSNSDLMYQVLDWKRFWACVTAVLNC
jgi:hypothetical protein